MVPFFKVVFFFLLVSSIVGVFADTSDFSLLGFLFILVWLIGWYFAVRHWKSVYLNGDVMRVSGFLKTIEIPVSDITGVEDSRPLGRQPHTVILKLKSSSIFGREIAFIPKGRWFNARSFADELRRTLSLF